MAARFNNTCKGKELMIRLMMLFKGRMSLGYLILNEIRTANNCR